MRDIVKNYRAGKATEEDKLSLARSFIRDGWNGTTTQDAREWSVSFHWLVHELRLDELVKIRSSKVPAYFPTSYDKDTLYQAPLVPPFVHACLVDYNVVPEVFEVLKADPLNMSIEDVAKLIKDRKVANIDDMRMSNLQHLIDAVVAQGSLTFQMLSTLLPKDVLLSRVDSGGSFPYTAQMEQEYTDLTNEISIPNGLSFTPLQTRILEARQEVDVEDVELEDVEMQDAQMQDAQMQELQELQSSKLGVSTVERLNETQRAILDLFWKRIDTLETYAIKVMDAAFQAKCKNLRQRATPFYRAEMRTGERQPRGTRYYQLHLTGI